MERTTAWFSLEDQRLEGLGTVLAVLDAGHTDLTNRFPSGKAAQRMRKAVIDAIIMSVGEEKASELRKRKAETEKKSGGERAAQKTPPSKAGRR